MIITVSSTDHLSAFKALASCPNVDITLTPANVGDRLDVTFDEKDEAVAKAIIAILSAGMVEEDDGEEDGSRKGRRRWIGDDIVAVNEKEAEKMLKAGLGRKGMAYDGDGKWTVSRDALTAFEIWKKLKAVKSKAKENYRGR